MSRADDLEGRIDDLEGRLDELEADQSDRADEIYDQMVQTELLLVLLVAECMRSPNPQERTQALVDLATRNITERLPELPELVARKLEQCKVRLLNRIDRASGTK